MKFSGFLKTLGIFLLGLIILLSSTVYLVYHNTGDSFSEVQSSFLSAPVKVYRDALGTPTIIGENLKDVLFAQGYEFARDRLWQLEFYRSVAAGELSRLFGKDLVNADKALRKMGIYRAAEVAASKLSPQFVDYLEAYVAGVNEYIQTHQNALPLEFQILGVKPKQLTIVNVISMQGVMSFTLAYAGLSAELQRLQLVKKVGGEKSLEILPVDYKPAADYLRNVTVNDVGALGTDMSKNALIKVFGDLQKLAMGVGSNNWVVSGKLTQSGKPILANDMHLDLSAPGIWYQVQLIAKDGSLHVQGFALPGIPFIIAGHNEKIAWGYTNTRLDAVDLFYLKRNETHYLVNDTVWVPFDKKVETIEVKGSDPVEFSYELSKFGVMDTIDGTEYAIRWTLTEGYERDQIIRAIFGLNVAENVNDIHEALRYFAVPGQNVVFATVDGQIGYQFAGLIPLRKNGFGLLPQNGSNGNNDWIGEVPYEDQLFVVDPQKGYFVTANQDVDTRHQFYISDMYDVAYRAKRISQILENQTNFDLPSGKFSEQDIIRIQADVYTLAAEDILDPVIGSLMSYDFSSLTDDTNMVADALSLLKNWDKKVIASSTAATIFVTFRIHYVHQTFSDELGYNLTNDINYRSHGALVRFLKNPENVTWFDNVNTTTKENYVDIAAQALVNAIAQLKENLGDDMSKWTWGSLHQVTFVHPMGAVLSFLNVGSAPSNGSTFTVNAGGGYGWDVRNLDYSQAFGSSERIVARVESSWSNVYGITPPGISGNRFSKHYGDRFDDWRYVRLTKWTFGEKNVIETQQLAVEYKKEEL